MQKPVAARQHGQAAYAGGSSCQQWGVLCRQDSSTASWCGQTLPGQMGKHRGCAHSSAQLCSHLAGGDRLALACTGASAVGCGMPWSSVVAPVLFGKVWAEPFAICMCCPADVFVCKMCCCGPSACDLGSCEHCIIVAHVAHVRAEANHPKGQRCAGRGIFLTTSESV